MTEPDRGAARETPVWIELSDATLPPKTDGDVLVLTFRGKPLITEAMEVHRLWRTKENGEVCYYKAWAPLTVLAQLSHPPAPQSAEQVAVTVPREPTEAMLEAGDALLYDTAECAHNVWNAMLAASAPDQKRKSGCPQEAIDLLQEGATGFGRLLISTSDDKAVRNWQKRCRAFLAKTITGAG